MYNEDKLKEHYPNLYKIKEKIYLEQIKAPLSELAIDSLEQRVGVPLPESYRKFLNNCGGFWAFGGAVQLGNQHPFKHEFEDYESLTERQKEIVKTKGGQWPPPSSGMICFAEFFWKADGDQVLFETGSGLINGEYPIYCYSHESNPPTIEKIADSFGQWLDEFHTYFRSDDE